MKPWATRLMWWVIGVMLLVSMVGCVLYYGQDKILFHPSHYILDDTRSSEVGRVRLEYATADGKQVAYYQPPNGDGDPAAMPRRLWLMFCGNASLALDLNFLAIPPVGEEDNAGSQGVAFLFVEYPGYGECQGKSSRVGIHRNVAASMTELAGHLGTEPEEVWQRAACFGHSLGAAVAMETAAGHGVEDVVVVSPFLSIEAMAARLTAAPVSGWIRHNFDNATALDKVATFDGADVHIFHGEIDPVIPVTMGRALAERHPEVITYREIPNTGHNDIMGKLVGDLRRLFYR